MFRWWDLKEEGYFEILSVDGITVWKRVLKKQDGSV
jgi:hypothetical protein